MSIDLQKFITEHEMSDCLEQFFSQYLKFHHLKNLRELRGPVGIPDHVLVRNAGPNLLFSMAFELKLKDWKKGLIQAFRYRAYVNTSFVVLDERFIQPALDRIAEFERAKIGLASYSIDSRFTVWYNPPAQTPFSRTLAKDFAAETRERLRQKKTTEIQDRFVRSTLGALDARLLDNSKEKSS